MKASAVSFALLLAAAPLPASFESVGIRMTEEPQMPARLRMDGLRDGRVTMAVDVDAEGKLTDWLVLEASHAELIRACGEAVQRWEFAPARYNGSRVSARVQFTLHISQVGAVVSRTTADIVGDFMERVSGRPLDYRICPPGEIDRPLAPVTRVGPQYAAEAKRQGVGGRVRVHFFVDEQGRVRLPAVPAETHPYLAAVAVAAMREWTFEPPTRAGRPVLVAAVQDFDFDGR